MLFPSIYKMVDIFLALLAQLLGIDLLFIGK